MRYSRVSGGGKSIALIGMMGVGKSSVAQCLRRRTGLNLLDTDEVIASSFGMSIPEIFTEHGEKKFREAETELLRADIPYCTNCVDRIEPIKTTNNPTDPLPVT